MDLKIIILSLHGATHLGIQFEQKLSIPLKVNDVLGTEKNDCIPLILNFQHHNLIG